MSDEISYAGIDEAVLVHGLFHGTTAVGRGLLHDRPGLTVEDIRKTLRPDALGRISIDYLAGRPLKVAINTKTKMVSTRLYDRDAGHGACQKIVNALRSSDPPKDELLLAMSIQNAASRSLVATQKSLYRNKFGWRCDRFYKRGKNKTVACCALGAIGLEASSIRFFLEATRSSDRKATKQVRENAERAIGNGNDLFGNETSLSKYRQWYEQSWFAFGLAFQNALEAHSDV